MSNLPPAFAAALRRRARADVDEHNAADTREAVRDVLEALFALRAAGPPRYVVSRDPPRFVEIGGGAEN